MMMKNNVFVEKAIDIAKNYKTVYANGIFGSLLSRDIIAQKAKQLPNWYTGTRQTMLYELVDKGYYGFDCVCFIKAILWGWSGDCSRIYGGAIYESNGVPDITEDTMLKVCSNISTDFTQIVPGEFLWISGHCGIYIGDGLAVECTPKWDNKVQITAVANIGSKNGYNARTWSKHGKLPYVDYSDIDETSASSAMSSGTTMDLDSSSNSQITVSLHILRQGELRGNKQIGTAQRILKMLGYYSLEIDLSFGPGMYNAVKQFQKDKQLDADGIIGINTWTALLKG